MKVALLYSGLVRTLPQTWPTVQRHLGKYKPDVYFYLNEPAKADIVETLLHPKKMLAELDHTFPEHNYAANLGPGTNAIQNDLRQLNGMCAANALRRSTGIAYDWVFRMRADIEIIQGPEPLESLDPRLIYIPKINNWFGYSDRIGFGPPHLMDRYLDRFNEFHEFMQNGGIFHMETFLAYTLRKHRIRIARTNIRTNTVRMNGSRDEPYQSLAWSDVP